MKLFFQIFYFFELLKYDYIMEKQEAFRKDQLFLL